jgi:hypothetical protein
VYRDYINHYSKNPTVAWDKENSTADYQLLWDGLCKDGYASGLGREIERGKGVDRYTLSRYSSESRVKPVRYIQEDYLNGNRREGDLNNHIYVDVGYENRYKRLSVYAQGLHSTFPLEEVLKLDKIKKYTKGVNNVTFGLMPSSNRYTSKVTSYSPSFILYSVDYKDGSRLNIVRGFFDSPEYHSNTTSYNNKNGNLHGIFARGDTFLDSIFTRDVGDTKLYNNGALLGLVEKPEKYENVVNAIEKDIVDFSNEALVKRALSLTVKKEYTDSVCDKPSISGFINEGEYKEICKSLKLDKELTNYINLVGNIRRNPEKLKSSVVAAHDTRMDKWREEVGYPDIPWVNALTVAYTTAKRINKLQSNIIKARRASVRRSGLSASQIKLNDNDIRLGGNSSGLKKYYQDGGFGGFNNKSNKPNLNYYCNTYADDYVCNPSLMKKRYLGSSGSRYRYDLSNPFDRSIYSTDVGAQINDTFSSDRFLDQGFGQFGGGSD